MRESREKNEKWLLEMRRHELRSNLMSIQVELGAFKVFAVLLVLSHFFLSG